MSKTIYFQLAAVEIGQLPPGANANTDIVIGGVDTGVAEYYNASGTAATNGASDFVKFTPFNVTFAAPSQNAVLTVHTQDHDVTYLKWASAPVPNDFQIPAVSALFTKNADSVDFNNLKPAFVQSILNGANKYDGLGGSDTVILPDEAHETQSLDGSTQLNWQDSLSSQFETSSRVGDTYKIIGSDGIYFIKCGSGSDIITISNPHPSQISYNTSDGGSGHAVVNISGCNGDNVITAGTGAVTLNIDGYGNNTLQVDGAAPPSINGTVLTSQNPEFANEGSFTFKFLHDATDAFTGSLTGDGEFRVIGGTLNMSGGQNFTGDIFIDQATLVLSSPSAVGSGAIELADDIGGAVLQINGQSMPTNIIKGFKPQESVAIDLRNLAFAGNGRGSATLESGNVLQIDGDTGSASSPIYALHLDPTYDYSGLSFALTSDGHGGTDIGFGTPPAAPSSPQLVAASDTGISSTDGITSDTTPTVSGRAEAGSYVTLYDLDASTVLGHAVADSATGAYQITSTALTAGGHTLRVRAANDAGNGGLSDALQITIDSSTPPVPANPTLAPSSHTGPSANDGITRISNPTFVGTADPGSTVSLLDGKKQVGAATADATTGSYSVTSTSLADGTHALTIKVTDRAGNISGSSKPTTVIIDTKAPTTPAAPTLTAASDTGASSTDGVTSNTTPTFTGKTEAGATVRLYDTDESTLLGSATATASGAYTIVASPLAERTHALRVTATDKAGNTSQPSAPRTVVIDRTPPAAPSAPTLAPGSDTGLSSSDGITKIATPTLTGVTEANATVTLYDGSKKLASVAAGAAGSYTLKSPKLADGSHSLTVVATDVAGNISPSSSALNVLVDTKAPATPVAPTLTAASDTGISASDGITRIKTPTVVGTAEPGSTVTLYDGAKVLGMSISGSNRAYAITSSALADGTHKLTVKATDVAGNVSGASSAKTVVIDTIAPKVSITSPGGTTILPGQTISGKGEPGTIVKLTDNGQTVGVALAVGANGLWSEKVTLTLGAHTIVASDTDKAGNIGRSTPLAIRVASPAGATNQPPAAVEDGQNVNDDGIAQADTRTMGVLGNDTDPDPGETETLKVVGAHFESGSAQADVPISDGVPATISGRYGTLMLKADGTYVYTRQADQASIPLGASDVFGYTVADIHGATARTTLTIGVSTAKPLVVFDQSSQVAAGHTVSGSVLAGDSDPNGGTFSTTTSSGQSGKYGTLSLMSDGTFTYTAGNGLAIVEAPDGQPIIDIFPFGVGTSEGLLASAQLSINVLLSKDGFETVTNPAGSASFVIGATTLTLNQTVASTYGGIIQDGASGYVGGNIDIEGKSLTLGGINTYTGKTTVGGSLLLSGQASIADSSEIDLSKAASTFDISGGMAVETIQVLNGVAGSTVSLGSKTLDIESTAISRFSGTIKDGGSSGGIGGKLIVGGDGRVVLNHTNTYSGGTAVNGGTLELGALNAASKGSISLNGAVELQIDAAALTGTGAHLNFTNTVSVADTDAVIDLASLSYTSTTAAALTNGSLLVSNGSADVTLNLTGVASDTAVSTSSDGHGGTLVSLGSSDYAFHFLDQGLDRPVIPFKINSSGQMLILSGDVRDADGTIDQDASYHPDSSLADLNDDDIVLGLDNNNNGIVYTVQNGAFTIRDDIHPGSDQPNGISGFGYFTQSVGINNNGQILGQWQNSAGGYSYFAFLNSGDQTTVIEDPDGSYEIPNEYHDGGQPELVCTTTVADLNDQGDVVGTFVPGGRSSTTSGFIYKSGAYQTINDVLDAGSDGSTRLLFINNSDQIVGQYTTSSYNSGYFLDSENAFTRIADPKASSDQDTTVTGINNEGQIVGQYEASDGLSHGFVYYDGKYTTVDAKVGLSTYISGVNDSGTLIGYYVDSNGEEHGFYATPKKAMPFAAPEASTEARIAVVAPRADSIGADDLGRMVQAPSGNGRREPVAPHAHSEIASLSNLIQAMATMVQAPVSTITEVPSSLPIHAIQLAVAHH